MTATTASIEVRDYLAAVSRELSDLPVEERADLLEDLDSHLHEVMAEGEGSLAQRLGPPEQYAAELRASAGLTTSHQSTAWLQRAVAALSANAVWRRTAEHPWTRATLEFLPQLRPAWWIVRAWLAAGIIAGLYHGRGYQERRFSGHGIANLYRVSGLWAHGFTSPYVGVVLLVVAVPISISIGRRTFRGVARWLVATANVFAIAMVVPAVAALGGVSSGSQGVATGIPPGLFDNGAPVTNIYPYDAQGGPLDHVRLFDQNGQPLLGISGNTNEFQGGVALAVPMATAAPSANANYFPLPNAVTIYGPDGTPTTTVLPRPNIVVPPLPSASATLPTPSPSTTTNTPTGSAPVSSQP